MSPDHALVAQRVVDFRLEDLSGRNLGDAFRLPIHQLTDELDDRGGALARDHRDAVGVAHDDVAGAHDRAATTDGDVDLAGAILVAAAGAHAAAERGHAEPRDPHVHANGAVHDDAAELRGCRGVAHELAEYGARRVSAGAHDHDVAGSGELQRLVHHEIVRGPALHRDREAAQREAAARLHAGIHEAEPAHRVGDVRTGETAEAREEVGAEAGRGGEDAETGGAGVGHRGFLLTELLNRVGESYGSNVVWDTGYRPRRRATREGNQQRRATREGNQQRRATREGRLGKKRRAKSEDTVSSLLTRCSSPDRPSPVALRCSYRRSLPPQRQWPSTRYHPLRSCTQRCGTHSRRPSIGRSQRPCIHANSASRHAHHPRIHTKPTAGAAGITSTRSTGGCREIYTTPTRGGPFITQPVDTPASSTSNSSVRILTLFDILTS